MKIEAKDEVELKHYKDRALMLRMLCLDAMGENILADVSSFQKRKKVKLQLEIEKRWEDADILERFNELCIQAVFDNPQIAETLPVMTTREENSEINLITEEPLMA